MNNKMKQKKICTTFVLLCMMLLINLPVTAAGVPAVKSGSNIFVPCKTLFARNGMNVSYKEDGNKVTIRHGKRKIIYYANKKYAKVNGKKMKLNAAPYFGTYKSGNPRDFYVPARQTASFLGLKYFGTGNVNTVTFGVRTDIEKSVTQASKVSKSQFISKIGPLARSNYKRTGILASVTMAQGILESGWGQSSLAKNANNLFGMKKDLSGNNWEGSSWDGVNYYKKKTYEYGRKGRYKITAKFRKYSCLEDSIEDHSAYLLGARNGNRYRYAGITNTKSYKKQLKIIKKGGYATSGSYVKDLCKVIRTYNLTKWDK